MDFSFLSHKRNIIHYIGEFYQTHEELSWAYRLVT